MKQEARRAERGMHGQQARPAIHLHIDHLILEGLPIDRAQGPAIQAAVEAELSRLLTEQGFGGELQQGGAVPSVHANGIQLSSTTNASNLGQQIAQSVYSGMSRTR